MKYILVLAACLTMASAQAQTLKQKQMMKDNATELKGYSDRMQKACGCAPKMQFDYKEFTTDNDRLIPVRVGSDVADAMEKLCKDADSKKTVCSKVKTIVGKKGTPVNPTFKNGTLTVIRETDNGYGDVFDVLSNSL